MVSIQIYVNGEVVTPILPLNDGYWHHLCVTWKSNGGQWEAYVDGHRLRSGAGLATGTYIRGGGHLILGRHIQ